MSVCTSQITALSWHWPGSHWSINMFTLVQTSELLFQSQTHFVRVVVELTERSWRSLVENHRGRASQEVDAMRTRQPVQTSVVVVMQRTTLTAAQHRKERKVSVCNGAHILPPVTHTHRRARTHTHTRNCSLNSSWVFWLQTTAAPFLQLRETLPPSHTPPPFILCWVSKSDPPHDEA